MLGGRGSSLITGALIVVITIGSLQAPAAAARARRPNILIIVSDDQRSGTLTQMSSTQSWFVRGGISFVNAFATTPLCCPARSSILTGLYAHNHGVKQNGYDQALDQNTTLPHVLHEAGYLTAMAGKFLNFWRLSNNPPNFDQWAIQKNGYYKSKFNTNGDLRIIDRYSVDYIRRKSIRFLEFFERRDRRPWFLYVTPHAPHLPAIVEPAHVDSPIPGWRPNLAVREVDRSDKPPWIRDHRVSVTMRRTRARQLRTLQSVDDLVQRIRSRLQRLNETRRTLAFYLSDNGFLWGEHGLMNKRFPYRMSPEIPLLARWPNHFAPGRKDRRLVGNIDIAPTVLDAARVEPPAPLDGRSLLQSWSRAYLLLEYWRDIHARWIPTWASIRTKRSQFIEYYGDDETSVIFREHYRLRTDPWQLRNTLRDGNRRNDPPVRRLHRTLANLRGCAGADCP